jgi:hypothetical protein
MLRRRSSASTSFVLARSFLTGLRALQLDTSHTAASHGNDEERPTQNKSLANPGYTQSESPGGLWI